MTWLVLETDAENLVATNQHRRLTFWNAQLQVAALLFVVQSKEAVILSPEDVYLLQDYFGEYIFRLDERRNRLDAEGVSQEDQVTYLK